MKQLTTIVVLSALGILVWLLSYHLSSDALAMAIGLTFGALLCVGPLLLMLFSRQHQPLRREDDTRVVHITYNDNRQITFSTPQDMPLLMDVTQDRRALTRR